MFGEEWHSFSTSRELAVFTSFLSPWLRCNLIEAQLFRLGIMQALVIASRIKKWHLPVVFRRASCFPNSLEGLRLGCSSWHEVRQD